MHREPVVPVVAVRAARAAGQNVAAIGLRSAEVLVVALVVAVPRLVVRLRRHGAVVVVIIVAHDGSSLGLDAGTERRDARVCTRDLGAAQTHGEHTAACGWLDHSVLAKSGEVLEEVAQLLSVDLPVVIIVGQAEDVAYVAHALAILRDLGLALNRNPCLEHRAGEVVQCQHAVAVAVGVVDHALGGMIDLDWQRQRVGAESQQPRQLHPKRPRS